MPMDHIREVFGAADIAERIAELGKAIRRDAGNQEIFLISILKGSSIFLADLLRATPGDVRYHFVDVIREAEGEDRPLDISFVTHFPMKGRVLYVLKDIVATGVIENYLLSQFRHRSPAEMKLVALLDRPSARRVLLPVDFRAFEVEDGTFVGYGLEHQGRYENLPYIGALESVTD
jgi:hypoxanthine phosphoribosyltransferase